MLKVVCSVALMNSILVVASVNVPVPEIVSPGAIAGGDVVVVVVSAVVVVVDSVVVVYSVVVVDCSTTSGAALCADTALGSAMAVRPAARAAAPPMRTRRRSVWIGAAASGQSRPEPLSTAMPGCAHGRSGRSGSVRC